VTDTNKLSDEEFLAYAYQQNAHAVRFAMELRHISHVLDDLIDKDKPVPDEAVRMAFWRALVILPANPFYMENLSYFHPLMSAALVNWQIANVFERGGPEDRNMAHSLRYDLATVLVMIAVLIGGARWGEQVGPEIRRRCQRQPLAEYLAELKKRFDKSTDEVSP
jgi:hypothetical protein